MTSESGNKQTHERLVKSLIYLSLICHFFSVLENLMGMQIASIDHIQVIKERCQRWLEAIHTCTGKD